MYLVLGYSMQSGTEQDTISQARNIKPAGKHTFLFM